MATIETAPPQIEEQLEQLPLYVKITLGVVIFALIAVGATLFMTDGPDWHLHYYPAGRLFWQGGDIYQMDYIFPNPPWTVALPAILAIVPMQVGRGIWFAMGFLSYIVIAYKLGARGFGLIAFMLAPPLVHDLLNANLNWLVLWGLVLPAQWGILLLVIKPQIGGFAVLYRLVEQYQQGSIRGVIKAVLPTLILTIIGMVMYGLWFVTILNNGISENLTTYNSTLFPYSIPFGLIALYLSWRRKDITWAIAAGPLLSPYASFHSYVALLMPFCKSQKWMVLAVSILWALVIWTIVSGGA
jgi:hypothetical protein